MNDETFDDPEVAKQWIKTIESEDAKIRESDIYPLLKAWVVRTRLTDILEIGAGQGAGCQPVDLEGRRYTGMDGSKILIARAVELYSHHFRSFVVGNAYTLPFQKNMFDGVFSVLLWHLLKNLNLAAQEMGRVLKPEGHFLIVTANPDAYPAWQALQTIGDALQFHKMPDIESALTQNGFVIKKNTPLRKTATAPTGFLLAIEGSKK